MLGSGALASAPSLAPLLSKREIGRRAPRAPAAFSVLACSAWISFFVRRVPGFGPGFAFAIFADVAAGGAAARLLRLARVVTPRPAFFLISSFFFTYFPGPVGSSLGAFPRLGRDPARTSLPQSPPV